MRQDKLLIVHHSADLDGRFSGMLARKVFEKYIINNSAKIVGYNYGVDEKIDTWLGTDGEKFDKYLFIDVTPPLDWLKRYETEIIEESLFVTICDHHETKYKEIFEISLTTEIPYYYADNLCGAKLFYLHYRAIVEKLMFEQSDVNLYQIKNLEEIIKYVSLYDTWQFTEKDETTMSITLAIKEYFDMFSDIGSLENAFDNIKSISSIIGIGNLLVEKSKNTVEIEVAKGEFLDSSEFINVWPKLKAVFPTNENIYLFPGYPNYYSGELLKRYDYYIGYSINLKDQIVDFSIRSRNGGNAANFAKVLNKDGGGHKQAAGCEISIGNFIKLLKHLE